MDKRQITPVVCEAIAVVLGKPSPVSINFSRANSSEWDSLKHVEIMFALEDRFNVRFDEVDLEKLDSVEKIAARIIQLHEA
jgi:acyl carrier protein